MLHWGTVENVDGGSVQPQWQSAQALPWHWGLLGSWQPLRGATLGDMLPAVFNCVFMLVLTWQNFNGMSVRPIDKEHGFLFSQPFSLCCQLKDL